MKTFLDGNSAHRNSIMLSCTHVSSTLEIQKIAGNLRKKNDVGGIYSYDRDFNGIEGINRIEP